MATPETRKCAVCKAVKPVSEFYFNHALGKPDYYCKDCRKAYQAEDYKRNPGAHQEYGRRERAKLTPEKRRAQKLKWSYGLTTEAFLKLKTQQRNSCAICGTVFRNESDAQVDHDHLTGEVRGLLCMGCNHGIGKFKDSLTLLDRAQYYLFGVRSIESDKPDFDFVEICRGHK